jgi:tetratricopeptide (TPR) repeat protein
VTAVAASAGGRHVRLWNWLAAAALAVVAVIAADALRTAPESVEPAPPLDPAELRPGFGPATFDAALAAADRAVDGGRAALAAHPDEWLRMEVLARALAARPRLAARAADLAEADRLLDRALATAPWPAGPALTAAEVALAMHDLDRAERALARFDASAVPPPSDEQAAARSIRCEIAFQRGDLPRARQLCGGDDDLASPLRRANLAAKSGDTGAAIRIVEAQLRRARLSPQALATLALQRASLALAEGDWQASGTWARAAERAFPGYWLSEAYVAQQFALEGDRAEAARRYAELAERTGDAEVLDALARLAEADGGTGEARQWAARAGAAWDERERLLPMTYATHHAEHLLLHGDSRRALALAQADYGRRPYPGTVVHYAYALWRSGEPARALEVVRRAESGGFMTAEIKLVEALALSSLGRATKAGAALGEARRRNPRIDSLDQQFVAFGRD